MKTTLKLTLSRIKRKDNTRRIVIRMVHKRKHTTFQTDFNVLDSDWNSEIEKIKPCSKQYPNIEKVNAKLFSIKSDLYDRIEAIGKLKLNISTATHLKRIILDRPKVITYSSYSTFLEEEFKKINRYGNAKIYAYARSFFYRHNGYRDIRFDQITYSWLKRVELFHLTAGNGYNSLSINMRTLRAVYNRAIKEGYAKQENYPFKEYKIRNTKTKKRAVDKNVIQRIELYNPKEGSMREFAKDIFLFSFYTQGMNITDIANLKNSSIKNGRVEYKRAKTGGFLSIALSEKAKAIISKYIDLKHPNNFLFPIIRRIEDPEMVGKDIYNATRNTNKNMQKIAKELGITDNITTYVARHSWATIAKSKGLDVSLISQGLGHQDLKTTQIYLDTLDSAIMDEANKIITE